MISEIGFVLLCLLSYATLLAGVFGRKAYLTFMSVGIFAVTSVMSGNVGNPETNILYPDYVSFGVLFGAFAAIAATIGIVQFMQEGRS